MIKSHNYSAFLFFLFSLTILVSTACFKFKSPTSPTTPPPNGGNDVSWIKQKGISIPCGGKQEYGRSIDVNVRYYITEKDSHVSTLLTCLSVDGKKILERSCGLRDGLYDRNGTTLNSPYMPVGYINEVDQTNYVIHRLGPNLPGMPGDDKPAVAEEIVPCTIRFFGCALCPVQ